MAFRLNWKLKFTPTRSGRRVFLIAISCVLKIRRLFQRSVSKTAFTFSDGYVIKTKNQDVRGCPGVLILAQKKSDRISPVALSVACVSVLCNGLGWFGFSFDIAVEFQGIFRQAFRIVMECLDFRGDFIDQM